jgi:YggT family protein
MAYIYSFVDVLFTVISYAILARVILSWFPSAANNPIGKFLFEVTEPILGPIRRILPSFGMIDFSPIVAFFLLQILQQLILSSMSPF